ncbi:MAG: GTPase domain-containing protein [Acidobacteria bacterium]|nr:GTPase domain-containing protein [Acidobacteriota bacterium]MBI3486963.1 GTPase domain-containing protein [Acidobacteriota bacterium]
MVLFNAATKELTAKIVYYGPGLCGKTTNLQHVYDTLPGDGRGKMLSLATQTDRTLFFDFLPIELGTIRGMKTRIQLYTVPGQVFYDATRKLVLRGADAVVFVADSQAPALESNKESFQNLITNLKDQGADLEKIPHVIQWNKRDTPNALPVDHLDREINLYGAPTFEACAMRGEGVKETLTGVAKLVLKSLAEKYGGGVVEEPAVMLGGAPPPPPPVQESTKPLEVEELSAGELLEEIDEIPSEASRPEAAPAASHLPHSSVVEVPVVLDRSLFSGDSPVEIRLKLYIK